VSGDRGPGDARHSRLCHGASHLRRVESTFHEEANAATALLGAMHPDLEAIVAAD